jgi:uncharacterized membrane protein YhaH (DUF805 family)
MKSYIDIWKHSFDFRGSLARRPFWTYVSITLWLYIGVAAIDVFVLNQIAPFPFLLTAIFSAVNFVTGLSAMVRRLHDTSRSGWWLLVMLFPVVGQILMITYLVQRTTAEDEYDNRGIGSVEVDDDFDPEEVYGKEFWNVEEEPAPEDGEEGEALSVENHIPGKIF